MSTREGVRHGLFGCLSALLAVKLLVKKGLFVADDVITHQYAHLSLELALVEFPGSVFGTIGEFVLRLVDVDASAAAIGLVIGYPLFVVCIVALLETPNVRLLASYWTGSTLITGAAVSSSLGLAPDPGGVGSGLVYHLLNHTIAVTVRDGIVTLGQTISTVSVPPFGEPVSEVGGMVIALSVAAVCYAVGWELLIGHRGESEANVSDQ